MLTESFDLRLLIAPLVLKNMSAASPDYDELGLAMARLPGFTLDIRRDVSREPTGLSG